MKPFTRIQVSTGHVFEVPTVAIASNRSQTMFEAHPDKFSDYDAAFKDTVELFGDSNEICDWAMNNMNPDEYLSRSRLVRFQAPEQDFNSAKWSYHDRPSIVGELDGYQILRQPVEFVLSTMAASRQMVSMTVLNDGESKLFGAMVLILGDKPILDSFIAALQFTSGCIASNTPDKTN